MAILVLVIRRIRPGFGFSWLAALLASVVYWGMMIYFRFSAPPAVIFSQWLPLGGVSGSLIFQLDDVSWAYSFSLGSILLLVIMTAVARLQHQSNPGSWAACLGLVGVGSLAMFSASPLAVVITWTAIDTFELIVILTGVPARTIKVEAVIAFFARMAGTLSLIFAMILARSSGQALIFIEPGTQAGLFILIAVGLRLGVLPLHLPYTREISMRRGLGTLLRLTSPLTSLVLLGRLPVSVVPVEIAPFLLGLTSLAVLYGAFMWVTAKHEIQGRPYWLISMAGMAVACSIRGYPLASVAWGVNLALSGGILFLYSVRSKRFWFIPIIGLVFLSGLPFIPTAGGWLGLVVLPMNIPDFLFITAQAVLILGYMLHSFRSDDSPERFERWIQTIYPMGFVFVVASGGLLAVLGWPGSVTAGVWWASLLAVALAGAAYWQILRLRILSHQPIEDRWYMVVGRRAGSIISNVLSLTWFYSLLRWILRGIQMVITTFTAILEGEGGVLWVFVLLALVLSLSLAGS